MSFVGLTKDWYPHKRICLFISLERSLLCAERVEDRWRTFLFTLWLRSVNNSLHCWCSAYPKTVHIKRICLQSEQFTHSVRPVCPSLCVELFCLWPTHTLTSTSLLYWSPSPLAFSHDSCMNSPNILYCISTSPACGVLWVRAAFGSSEPSGKEQTGEVGGVWVCVFPSWCVNWWWSAELPDGVGKVQIDSLHSSSLRRQTQGPLCTGLYAGEQKTSVCIWVFA